MANISVERGTLVVEKERQEVVETIAAVNENNVSVKRGTLVMKSMEQIARESVPESTATQSLAEPFRQPIAQEGESLRPQVRPEPTQVTDLPIPEKPDVQVEKLPDAPKPDIAADEVQSTDGKVEDAAPTREALISSVFKAEGGYSEDKADSGNYINGKFIGTNHGISAPTLAEYLGREPTVEEMKNLTKDEAREIAATKYYDRFKINSLPNNLQEIVFHAVFMGETRGVRAIQNLLGITPDGVLGSETEAAMQKADFTKEEFKDEFLRELEFGTSKTDPKTNEPYSKPSPTWNIHGKGWTDRYKELAK